MYKWQPAKQMKKLTNMMQKYSEESDIDLMMFPEQAMTAGTFRNTEEAKSMAQQQGQGSIFEWAQQVSLKYKCIVAYGYVEYDPNDYNCYNSMCVVSEKGEVIKNYRKHQLYPTETWAIAGPSFDYADIYFWRIDRTIRCGLAICMDIWFTEEQKYEGMEFAKFQRDNQSQLILGISGWYDFGGYDDDDIKAEIQKSYWLNRLTHLIHDKSYNQNRYFIWCNRVGKGYGTFKKFVGLSGIFLLQPKLTHLRNLSTVEEGILEQVIQL
eukprot:403355448